jgi:hypothetical protein
LSLADRLLLLSKSLQPSSKSLMPPVVIAADDGAVDSTSTRIKRKRSDDDDESLVTEKTINQTMMKKTKLGLADRLLLLSNSLQPSSESLIPPVVTAAAADDGASVASTSTDINRTSEDEGIINLMEAVSLTLHDSDLNPQTPAAINNSNSLQPSSESLMSPVVTAAAADNGAVASTSTDIKRKIKDDDDESFPAFPKSKIIKKKREKLVRLTYELLQEAGLVDDPMGCSQDDAADKLKWLSILESSPTPFVNISFN